MSDGYVSDAPGRGWWNMPCYNALSLEQQKRVVEVGNLPMGYEPEGDLCSKGAEVEVATLWDRFPGPRFYCRMCAIEWLVSLDELSLGAPE